MPLVMLLVPLGPLIFLIYFSSTFSSAGIFNFSSAGTINFSSTGTFIFSSARTFLHLNAISYAFSSVGTFFVL